MVDIDQTMTVVAFSFFMILAAVRGAQWSSGPADGATVYVCEGRELTLAWNVSPGSGEHIGHTEWFFDGQSNQMIAIYSDSTFLPSPSYSQRVQFIPNSGITMSHVTTGDVGNYRVEVQVLDASDVQHTYHHTITLHVASVSVARTDATVEVTQQPRAVYDNQTGEHHLQVTCTSHGRLPPAVIWMLPSGQEVESSAPDGEAFSLLVPNPVTGGNYSCRVPPDAPPAQCLPKDDPVLQGHTVYVDEMRSRVTLLEADLRKERADMTAQIIQLQQHVQALETQNSKQVIFHAKLGRYTQVFLLQPIIFTGVIVNKGNAYSATTGQFTVPFNGSYFFTATTGADYTTGTPYTADISLIVDGSRVSQANSRSVDYIEQGTCSYAAHLTVGQNVWVRSGSDGFSHHYFTTFTGFLVSAD